MINQRIPLTDLASEGPKPSLRGWFRNHIKTLAQSEKGAASLEFVVCIPVIMAIFMASIESGVFMTRYVMLEQSVDKVMRNLRLGKYPNVTVADLKTAICDRSSILHNCASAITIDLQPISTTTWAFPTDSTTCVDRDAHITPSTTFNPGTEHQIMLVRVCVIQDAMFPTTGLGLNLAQDEQGGYALLAKSAFVNEP
jgi:Flp pilus assembly protein TadG